MTQNAENSRDNTKSSATDMQEANALGTHNNEQGQSEFVTGSTTGGGSNYGQGSSHLGGESYQQGDRANAGSNYSNEQGRLGESAIGTSNEGSSSPVAGAAQSGNSTDQALNPGTSGTSSSRDDDQLSVNEERAPQTNEKVPEEGERRNTTREEATSLETDNTTADRRQDGGSWSQSSTDNT